MMWEKSWRADQIARRIADRHYNREQIGTQQFVPPGRCVVLLAAQGVGLWVTSWPYAEFTKHDWAGAWVNSTYRRESGPLASDEIRAGVAATRYLFGDPPALGMVTFVDPGVVAGFFRRSSSGRTLDWGYAYHRAGFRHVGWTKTRGYYVLQLTPGDMPPPEPPLGDLGL